MAVPDQVDQVEQARLAAQQRKAPDMNYGPSIPRGQVRSNFSPGTRVKGPIKLKAPSMNASNTTK